MINYFFLRGIYSSSAILGLLVFPKKQRGSSLSGKLGPNSHNFVRYELIFAITLTALKSKGCYCYNVVRSELSCSLLIF